MFTPVYVEDFYGSPVGEQFLDRYSSEDRDIARNIDWKQVREQVEAGQQPDEEDWLTAKFIRCANWLTANYRRDTGLCTLYRGIDQPMVDNLHETGAFTSRAVTIFGLDDMQEAERAMREAAGGTLNNSVRDRIIALIEDAESTLDEDLLYVLDDTRKFLDGQASELTRNELLRSADLLEVVMRGGEEGYRAIMERARSGDDGPIHGSVDSLMYPSIHLTTDPNFIRSSSKSGWFTHMVRVDFEPGALNVAPEVGIIGNNLLSPQWLPGLGEAEWYGIGRLDLTSLGVHSYAVEKIS